MKNNTWLLIANASKARIYSFCKAHLLQSPSPNSKDLSLEEEHEHLESRKKVLDLLTDKLGDYGNGAFAAPSNPKEHEADIFAKVLAEKLDAIRKEDQTREFIIAASPAFLGLIKKHLAGPLHKKTHFIQKDYTAHEGKQLVADLISHL